MRVLGVDQTVEAFFRAESGRLLGALTLYTGDRDLAAELVQEAFARAHDRWPHVSGLDSPAAWTYRVAVNLANSHVRRLRYERAARRRAAARLVDPPAPDAEGPEVRQALLSLPPRQREALVLRFLLDLSVDEAARRMACAPGTVRSLTAQGVARLRESALLLDLVEPHRD